MIVDGNAYLKKVRGSSNYRLRVEVSPDDQLDGDELEAWREYVQTTGDVNMAVLPDHNADDLT